MRYPHLWKLRIGAVMPVQPLYALRVPQNTRRAAV